MEVVRPICDDVPSTAVPAAALAQALRGLDAAVRAALDEAIRRTRAVHEAQLPSDSVTRVANGATVTERYVPVGRVGLYVPGGSVSYPSSVVMNVVPAQVAGVGSVAVASPPRREHDGLPHPAILAACALLGVTEVHAVGGAQAIAMFAYGTADCAAADMVTGPGNVYVAAAKRLLRGRIGVDAEAGPTEIAIIADHTADPVLVAADLIAQAEHDELAACLHVTPDHQLADRVEAELARQVEAATHRKRVEAALRGQSAQVLVDDIAAALMVTDAWAPEHLEMQTEHAARDAARVRNAGAVFVGPYAPVSLGDYLAGSNPELPKDLADYLGHGLTSRHVWAANGSNEVIQQLLQAFGGPGRVALGFEPSYSMHPIIARTTGTTWVGEGRGEDFALSADRAVAAVRGLRPDLVFLTSPNNPTGAALPVKVIEAVCDVAPGMVVVDEAYAEFARDDTVGALTLLPGHQRLVVTRTMSKAFAMAGVRLGYLAADPAVIDALLLVRLPYHLSAVTQAVARAALVNAGELLEAVAALRMERDATVAWLRGRGLAAADSDANFVLFGEFADRRAVWQGLLDHGVLVREVGPAGWLRVSIGTPAEMARFRRALSDGMARGGGGV